MTAEPLTDDVLALWKRRAHLIHLRDSTTAELLAVEHRLRDKGAPGMAGRPRRPYTMTREEATEAHRLYNAGQRDERVIRGEREYSRRQKRDARLRASTSRQPGLDDKPTNRGRRA